MKTIITIEFDNQKASIEQMLLSTHPNEKENPKPDEGDNTVNPGKQEDDEGDIKPYK
ncbi:hypothetical protein [Tenacibaculum agarivorans]|uniref:hypothetical protein n=1 Tax=Tenacibaculum agarivorans TaxID=1908389 RepID=UPI000A7D01A0|nr:hypothetical protein [Tenacibaculum agarivorans]